MTKPFASIPAGRHNERGTGRVKLIIVLAIVALVGYMGFQYIPVAYQAYTFKKFMGDIAEKAAVLQISTEQKGAWIENQLRTSGKDYGVPPEAKITHTYQENMMQITVRFTRPINLLPGFTYQYNFEHTAKSSTFLTVN